MPARCQTLIIGAGIVGNSVAYHLSELGQRDLVLIDKVNMGMHKRSIGNRGNSIRI